MRLEFFSAYTMSPYGWGHSHLLGRVKYHLKWTLHKLNVRSTTHALFNYLRRQPAFPEVTHFGANEALAQRLVKNSGLEAYQAASAMIMMPFVLACCTTAKISRDMLMAWRLENMFAIDYYRQSFTEEQILRHKQMWGWLKGVIEKIYLTPAGGATTANKVKFHDPEHDEDIIRGYGNFCIINELPKEAAHQTPKTTTHNNRGVEIQMLKKVSGE